MKNKKYSAKFKWLVAGLVVLLLPYLFTILYTVPAKDDFVMALGMTDGSLFKNSIERANHYYLEWTGIYYFSFLEVFLNPLLLFDSSASFGIGVEMLIFFALLILAIALCVNEFAKEYLQLETKEGVLGLLLLFLFAVLNTGIYSEVFYWFVGAEYMWGTTLTLITLFFEMKYFKNISVKNGVALSIAGFISSITYYMCVPVGAAFLAFIISDKIKTGKLNIKKYIPLVFIVLGACVAAFAPGNFNRADTTSTSAAGSIIPAIANTCFIFVSEYMKLLANPIYIGCMIAFVVAGYFLFQKKAVCVKMPFVYFIIAAAIMWCTIFPQALGYGDHSITNRYEFVVYFYGTLLLAPCFMILGGYIADKKLIIIEKKQLTGIVFILALFVYGCTVTITGTKSPYVYTLSNMREVRNRSCQWKEMYRDIETSSEDVIVIDDVDYFETPVIKDPTVEAAWVRDGMNKWYNKTSIDWSDWTYLEE